MRRVYHHYEKWEEYHNKMWEGRSKEEEAELLEKAIKFTGNAELYGQYMIKVIREWPISCEQNLTATGVNKQAWIGHAACCIALGCPEHVTRRAWHQLTQEQQDKANAKADIAIATWQKEYRRRKINA